MAFFGLFGDPSGAATPPTAQAFDPVQAYQDANRRSQWEALGQLGSRMMIAGAPSTNPASGSWGYGLGHGLNAAYDTLRQGRQDAFRGATTMAGLSDWQRTQAKAREEEATRNAWLRSIGVDPGTGMPTASPGQATVLQPSAGAAIQSPSAMPSGGLLGPGPRATPYGGLLDPNNTFGTSGMGAPDGAGEIPPPPVSQSLPMSAPTAAPRGRLPAGMTPEEARWLAASSPATLYAALKPKPLVSVGRGGLYDPNTNRKVVEGEPSSPLVKDFQIGDRTVPHQWNGTQWAPVEGMGGPKWNPTERGQAITPMQLANNAEIDNARALLSERGMTPAQIRKAATDSTQFGRENPDFDPAVARLARLAVEHKIGEDRGFDPSWQMILGGPGQPSNAGALGLPPGFLTDEADAGPSRTSVIGAGPGTLRGAVPVPTTATGQPDQKQLKHGQLYRSPTGVVAKWDSMKRGFVTVD